MNKIDKNKIIKDEIARYKEMYKDAAEDKLVQCQRLFEEAAYLYATMLECKVIIDKDGIIETYNNGGGQKGLKQNPASKYYLDCYKQFTSTTKQIQEFLCEKDNKDKDKDKKTNPMLDFAALRYDSRSK